MKLRNIHRTLIPEEMKVIQEPRNSDPNMKLFRFTERTRSVLGFTESGYLATPRKLNRRPNTREIDDLCNHLIFKLVHRHQSRRQRSFYNLKSLALSIQSSHNIGLMARMSPRNRRPSTRPHRARAADRRDPYTHIYNSVFSRIIQRTQQAHSR